MIDRLVDKSISRYNWSNYPIASLAKNIASDGKVSNDPVGTMPSGYAIIKTDSLDAAIAMAKGCPVLKSGAKISVFETAQALRERLGTPLPPYLQGEYETYQDRLQQALPQEELEPLWNAGRGLAVEQAIEAAAALVEAGDI